jgi:hypothetical protein
MPSTSGSTSGSLAGDPASRQLWTVRHSRDTTEIDLRGTVINSEDPTFVDAVCATGECAWFLLGPANLVDKNPLPCMFTGPRNLHILNGGLVFGAGFLPLTTFQPHTTLCLTSMKLTATDDYETNKNKPNSQKFVLVTTLPHSSIVLEDCVFETSLDSPLMCGLVVCTASFEGQVGLQDGRCNMHLQCLVQ